MPEPHVEHDTIRVTRRFLAAPRRVYGAWVDPSGRDRWDVPGEGWEHVTQQRDVRVGGRDVILFGPPGSVDLRAETVYLDLVSDQRIVMTYTVAKLGTLWSASVLTVELRPHGTGTEMVLTEQVALLDGHDSAQSRRAGFDDLLRNLEIRLGEPPSG